MAVKGLKKKKNFKKNVISVSIISEDLTVRYQQHYSFPIRLFPELARPYSKQHPNCASLITSGTSYNNTISATAA